MKKIKQKDKINKKYLKQPKTKFMNTYFLINICSLDKRIKLYLNKRLRK